MDDANYYQVDSISRTVTSLRDSEIYSAHFRKVSVRHNVQIVVYEIATNCDN